MEKPQEPVQNNTKKRRSQADKIGRLKYNQQLLKQTLAEVEWKSGVGIGQLLILR